MENIATKKSSYDFLSSLYKARGKSGASSRNVRAQRASENRQLSRMDEVSKRRRMPLSPLADENVDDEAVTVGKNGKHAYAKMPAAFDCPAAEQFFQAAVRQSNALLKLSKHA